MSNTKAKLSYRVVWRNENQEATYLDRVTNADTALAQARRLVEEDKHTVIIEVEKQWEWKNK